MDRRLRELDHVAKISHDVGSRNLGPIFRSSLYSFFPLFLEKTHLKIDFNFIFEHFLQH